MESESLDRRMVREATLGLLVLIGLLAILLLTVYLKARTIWDGTSEDLLTQPVTVYNIDRGNVLVPTKLPPLIPLPGVESNQMVDLGEIRPIAPERLAEWLGNRTGGIRIAATDINLPLGSDRSLDDLASPPLPPLGSESTQVPAPPVTTPPVTTPPVAETAEPLPAARSSLAFPQPNWPQLPAGLPTVREIPNRSSPARDTPNHSTPDRDTPDRDTQLQAATAQPADQTIPENTIGSTNHATAIHQLPAPPTTDSLTTIVAVTDTPDSLARLGPPPVALPPLGSPSANLPSPNSPSLGSPSPNLQSPNLPSLGSPTPNSPSPNSPSLGLPSPNLPSSTSLSPNSPSPNSPSPNSQLLNSPSSNSPSPNSPPLGLPSLGTDNLELPAPNVSTAEPRFVADSDSEPARRSDIAQPPTAAPQYTVDELKAAMQRVLLPDGISLREFSQQRYGDPRFATAILQLNRRRADSEGQFPPGTQLVVLPAAMFEFVYPDLVSAADARAPEGARGTVRPINFAEESAPRSTPPGPRNQPLAQPPLIQRSVLEPPPELPTQPIQNTLTMPPPTEWIVTEGGESLFQLAGEHLDQASHYLTLHQWNHELLEGRYRPTDPLPRGLRLRITPPPQR
jgi:hypothetical protein